MAKTDADEKKMRKKTNNKKKESAKRKLEDEENNDGTAADDEQPPQPVISDSESDQSDTEVDDKPPPAQMKQADDDDAPGMSRLFAPYRTLGLISTGSFALIPHQNSESAMLCITIGDRFQLMKTDRLQPVMVSRAISGTITHTVPDATLRATIVAHGKTQITLYQRTTPMATVRLMSSSSSKKSWKIQELLHLGRIQIEMDGEKEGKRENAAIIAAVLACQPPSTERDDTNLEAIGGEDSSDSDDDDDAASHDHDFSNEDCLGHVVILLATRTSLDIHRRIPLTTIPTFCPVTAVHPATYVNKIVLAGQDHEGHPAMCLLNVRSSKIIHVFDCLPAGKACVTCLEQSPAIDTVAVGLDNGAVHLVNLRHDKKLFSLKHAGADGSPVEITSISFRNDASALKYGIAPMAVGRADGTITVWDLTPPEEPSAGRAILCNMDRVHAGGICKLQYMPQEPLLVSTGRQSNSILIHIFDNPDHSGRILRQRKGHIAPPSRLRYLNPAGSILANSSDGTDASSCQILSSGGPDRTLRVFSTARSVLDKEYSQGQGLEKKARKFGLSSTAELLLPPLTAMALCETRRRDWGDLVTIHERHSLAYVWSTKRGAQSGPVLRQPHWNISAMKVPPPPETHATSVTISPCGNMALVGTAGGIIYKYNIQSGAPRGFFPPDAEHTDESAGKRLPVGHVARTMKVLEQSMKGARGNRASNLDKQDMDLEAEAKRSQVLKEKLRTASHAGYAVTGIAIDSVNKTVVSVGADAKLILWHFATHAPYQKSPYLLPSPATKLSHVRESDLAAIALQDFSIVLFDCAALAIVRRFGSGQVRHTAPISDLGFSPDGRNLYSSSLDGTIRVWDVPTNICIDWLSFKAVPTSLAVSPTGEFLATTHAGRVGISLWSDRSFYQRVRTDGGGLTEPICIDDPVPISDEYETRPTDHSIAPFAAKASLLPEPGQGRVVVPVKAKEDGLVTLSGLPPAHWKNLFHLELVKERNKPKEPPKKPPSAPFFLQWRSGEAINSASADEGAANGADNAGEEEWASAWTDDDGDANPADSTAAAAAAASDKSQRPMVPAKRQKVTHYRSHLADLLHKCKSRPPVGEGLQFQEVSDYIASIGPSAIDVALSTLCNGMHDLEEGLPLLLLASEWLLEACRSRERYEAVNAYLHRFLYLHAAVIAQVDDNDLGELVDHDVRDELRRSITQLRQTQRDASTTLQSKMQHSLCLLRHFARMN